MTCKEAEEILESIKDDGSLSVVEEAMLAVIRSMQYDIVCLKADVECLNNYSYRREE